MLRFLASLSLVFISAISQSLPNPPALIELSKSSAWQNLLHYRPQGIARTNYSQGDDPKFFLNKNGNVDPYAEIITSLHEFSKINIPDNNSAQCRFPARYHWLKSQLPTHTFVDQACSKFDVFFNTINGYSLTIIYPSSYLNSPSSMYGHTLVRIDRQDTSRSELLAYSVNFAANADLTDNDIVFSYKGLAGGYPGVVSVTPYYQKVKEYSGLESRDIWEYKLNIEKQHVDQFVRHIWETQDTWFDYFFISENCSYRLLALLDAAVPSLNLARQFPAATVPVDTVRILQTKGLVKEVIYRPSVANELSSMRRQVSTIIQELAIKLVLNPDTLQTHDFKNLTPIEQAQALELAYSYSRYLSVQEKRASPALRRTSLTLLSQRSKIAAKDVFMSVPTPTFRDDEGHNTQRLQFSAGESNEESFSQVGFRMTYHDLLDPVAGFLPGAQIQMLDLKLRHYQHKKLKVQTLNVIDITSLSTRNNFLKPAAWRVSGAFKRLLGSDGLSYWTLNGGRGIAYDTVGGIAYGLLESELAAGNDLDKGYRITAGAKLGWLYQNNDWQINTHVQWMDDIAGMQGQETHYNLGWAYNPSQNIQLRVKFKHQQWLTDGINEVSLGLGAYF
jgi:hypothetical protein